MSDLIALLAKEMIAANEPDPTTLTHHFASGSYVRELFIPQGTAIVGKIHKHETINILLSGALTIYTTDGESQFMKAPKIFTTPAGCRKAGFAHVDSVWLNVHTSEGDDLEAIEKKYITQEVVKL